MALKETRQYVVFLHSYLQGSVKLQCKNNSWQMFDNRESYMFDNEIHEADTLSFQT